MEKGGRLTRSVTDTRLAAELERPLIPARCNAKSPIAVADAFTFPANRGFPQGLKGHGCDVCVKGNTSTTGKILKQGQYLTPGQCSSKEHQRLLS